MASVLIVYGTTEGQTRKIAGRMAEMVTEYGHAATVMDAASGPPPLPINRYDGVIVAASVHRQRHQGPVVRFVEENRAELGRLPTAFFSVSLSAAGTEPRHRADARRCADAFLAETGWRPGMVRLAAGALAYTKYDLPTRWVLRLIAWREGADTDTTRDHEYTDWAQVERDVELFLTHAVPVAEIREPALAGW